MKPTIVNNLLQCALTVVALIVFLAAPIYTAAQSLETGTASYYHNKFIGRKTANGEIFDQNKLTAAHKSIPLGTWVKVTNLSNDSTVIVKINDRMPQWNKRSIDLSKTAATKLDYLHNGLAKVKIEIIPDPTTIAQSTFERETSIPDYIDIVAVNTLRQVGEAVMYPKLPLIQYLAMEKPKGGLFNFQR